MTVIKNLASLLSAVVLLTGYNDEVDNNMTVQGRIENVPDGSIILFYRQCNDGSTKTIARDTLINGCFEFTTQADRDAKYNIFAFNGELFPSIPLSFYAEPGSHVRIMGNDFLTANWSVKSNAKNQKIYQSFFCRVSDIYKDMQEIELEYRQEKKMSGSEFREACLALAKKSSAEELSWLKSQKKISVPWIDIMGNVADVADVTNDTTILNALRQLWSDVDAGIKNSPEGKAISLALRPREDMLEIGDLFPYSIEMYDIEGRKHSFKEFEGKAMLLYFGSFGCKPCVEAKKELDEIVSKGNGTIEVVGLNLDAESTWKGEGMRNPVRWHDFNELKGNHGLSSRFEVLGIPLFVVVSEDGIITDVWAGFRNGIINERINM